ncbi:hypothetical protein TrLO_g6041 [Triparma laevis f. longispina]|uniref:Uncharacterized protein n=1 Tax=Triparma laevis f. longispina TaxID=1714387 RepID=A0A9W7FT12_9STRA|nr:hypothetical protein TrLO_g6041 [Triparma laevis f. longispina]
MAKNVVTTSENAEDLYSRIANIFYERFKQENVIDQRQKEDFIKNIPTAPPLTDGERAIIKRHMDFYETMRLKAARIGGTVNESVEKFFHRESKVPWGLSVAICDVPAVSIFADLWLLNTYAKKAFNKGTAVLEVFENLDGTRSLCYVKSFGLPGGFQDRLFETWITWDMWVDEFTGKKTCIIVIHPFDAYAGEFRPQVFMNEKFIKADSTGTYIFKELTDNTCEWTWLQNADLNIARMPKNLLDFLTKSQLGWANEVQEQYKRNGRKVDRERVAALAKTMLSMQGVPLQQDQAEIFQRCLELFKGGGDEGWTLLKSPSPNVEMSMKYIKSSGGFGTRTIAMARGKCVIDCSAEEMAAWVMDVCSNNSMRMSREEGHPARIRLRGGNFDRVNEATLATIKRMPLTFDNREFVYRHIWKSEEGKVIIAFESVEEDLVVDYGVNKKKTRAFTRGLWQIENVPSNVEQCHVTIVSNINAGGHIPSWLADRKIASGLTILHTACEEFRQDEKMDRALVMDRATYLKDNWENEVYSEEENGLLKRAQEKFESGLMGRWKSLRSPDPFVAMDWVFDEGACHIVGRAVCILDAPLEYCAANELARDARGRYKEYFDFGGLDRKLVKVNNHCDIYHLVIDFGNGISPREFLTKCVWKRLDEKTLIVGFEDTDDVEFPIGSVGGQRGKYVRASAKSFWKYERLPDVEGVPQTKVMYCQMVDLRGSIPKLASHSASKIVDALAYVSRMRLKFDKSVEIDARRRAKIVTMIAEEPIDVEKGEEYLNEFETMFKDKAGCERPKRVYGLADGKVYADMFGGLGWGKTTVSCNAELEEVVAFFWDFCSRANMELTCDNERSCKDGPPGGRDGRGDKVRMVNRRLKIDSSTAAGHRDRECTSKLRCCRLDQDTTIVSMTPVEKDVESEGRQSLLRRIGSVFDGKFLAVEAQEKIYLRLRRIGPKKTVIDCAVQFELGMSVSFRATRAFVERHLKYIADVSVYFQRLVPLEACKAEDGVGMGYDILWKASSPKKRLERLAEVVDRSRTLRELSLVHSWFPVMLRSSCRGNLSLNRVIATKMDCLEEKEAIQIGKNLIASLKSKKLVDAGVDVWKNQNRAVKELSEKYEWLEPMTVVISKGIVKTAAWGLLWRVTLGAVLSITDLVTDIMVLKLFSDGGEAMHVFRNLSIFSLTFSLILLLLTVFYQHSNHGPLRIMKETVIVLIGMKAPWDAYKVAMGAEQEKGAQFDPMMELAISKCVELFAESIPSILIQTSAVIKTLQSGDQISSTALFSLLISVLTTGYVSATLSYDFDTDPKKRAFNPEFYGYVPDFPTKRALLFFTLINLSAVQVLIKSIFVALLGYLGSLYLVVYMAADMFLFLCYKLARRDMNCWLPMEDNIGSKTLFIFLRMMVKLIVDFTGCVQFRHPFELGGLYYSINLFTPLIGLGLLLAFVDMGGAFNDSVVKTLSNFTLLLGAGLVLLAALFLLLMSKKYRHTFFSVETGKQMTMRTFLHGDDYTRSLIFGTNKSHWIDIEDKVAQWLQFGWYRWEDERPDWFTDEWREIVPAKYKPKMSMRQMRKEKKMLENESEEEKRSEDKFKTNTRKSSVGGERRRSLLGAIFAGEATAGLEIVGNSGGGGGGWGGLGGGEGEGGGGRERRRFSSKSLSSSGRKMSQVFPDGDTGEVIDVDEMMREIKRRGSIKL